MGIKSFMRKHKLTYALGKLYRKIETTFKNIYIMFFAFLRKIGLFNKKYSKLKEFENKYCGKRCFIIATGPSLKTEDILLLKNEFTFSMNAMCLKYKELNWYPTFYGVQDAKVFDKVKDNIYSEKIKAIFIDKDYKSKIDLKKNYVFFPRNSVYNSYDAYIKKIYSSKFSYNPVSIVYDGFTIVYSLIQIAVYMGFKEIYLLGCDCNYTNDSNKNYYVNHGVVDVNYKEAGNRMIACYPVAKKFAEKKGVKIYNATRGGMLEVFERVNLDDIVK